MSIDYGKCFVKCFHSFVTQTKQRSTGSRIQYMEWIMESSLSPRRWSLIRRSPAGWGSMLLGAARGATGRGRIKLLPPEEIARRIDDRFRLLTGGSRTALPRQQTLRATMDWSYQLLSEAERALWRRLSVFRRGFAMDAAEAVCSACRRRRASCAARGQGRAAQAGAARARASACSRCDDPELVPPLQVPAAHAARDAHAATVRHVAPPASLSSCASLTVWSRCG